MINGIPDKDAKRLERIHGNFSCSICKKPFNAIDIVYTCTGYKDEQGHGKIHITTTDCCIKKLKCIVMIGVYGPENDPRLKAAITEHPLKDGLPSPDNVSKTKHSH